MQYELRLYAIPHGRMADIRRRMLVDVQPLFERHGLPAVAYWSVLAGPRLPAFVWMIEWRDAAEREAVWASFYADEEWWRIRAATNDGAELVEEYGLWIMRPHGHGQTFTSTFRPQDLHEMLVLEVGIGRGDAVAAVLDETVAPGIGAAGGVVLGTFELEAGPRIPTIVMLVSWPDLAARNTWYDGFTDDPAMRAAGGAGLLGRGDIYLLRPEAVDIAEAGYAAQNGDGST